MKIVEIWLDGAVIAFNAETVAEDKNIQTASDHYQFHNRNGEIVFEAAVRWKTRFSKAFEDAVAIFKNSEEL